VKPEILSGNADIELAQKILVKDTIRYSNVQEWPDANEKNNVDYDLFIGYGADFRPGGAGPRQHELCPTGDG
jgi:hypothetical protein